MRALAMTRWPRLPRIAVTLMLTLLAAASAGAFDLQGHRGARGLAPENTLAAFSEALALGVTTLELDVGISRDGVLVVSHDRYLNADITRDAQGEFLATRGPVIASLPLAELQRYDVGRIKPGSAYARVFAEQRGRDGERIPTLAAVFDLAAKRGANVRFNIETKVSPLAADETLPPEPFVRALIAAIRRAKLADRVTIQSFDWRTLQIAQRQAPEIATVYLSNEQGAGDTVRRAATNGSPWLAGLSLAEHGGSLPRLVRAAGGRIWSPNFRDLTLQQVEEAHTLGLSVIAWTVNDMNDAARLLDWGVDGIISDYPDRLRALLKSRGMALPTAYPPP